MKTSIRRLLVVNLLIAVAAIISLSTVGIYYVTNANIESHIDAELIYSNLLFQSILGDSIDHPASLKIIQKDMNQIPASHENIIANYGKLQTKNNNSTYDSSFQYQVWSKNGDLLLHSAGAPTVPMSDGIAGFSNTFIDKESWRIYTDKNPQTGATVIVAEDFSQQHILKDAIATNNIIVMLISFPLLGMLIWIIVNKSLSNIKNVAHEISQRAPRYLEEVNITHIPVEIQPLIEELNRLFGRLRQAFDREQRFAADAAHELRTPMAAIKTQTQVALKSDSEEEFKHALHKILAGVDRSTHVVQQLLTLSRLNPGSSMDKQNAINMVAIVSEIISELVPLAISNDAELEFDCDKDNITLLANAASIGILVRNLVDNAIRYTPEDGKVKIELKQLKNQVILRVSDNGPGIPEKLHGRVFERFFRVLGSQKPGSGLGLAIVEQIVSLHNAKLTLDKPAQGTGLVVEITFPNRLS